MEFLQLKYFIDAAKTENFSETAKKFFVPPSAVSQSIRRLETELGFKLFDRKANKVSLCAAGKIFYDAVTKAEDIILEARRKIEDSCGEITGEIYIAVLCNRRIVSKAIEIFKKLYPKVSFKLVHVYKDTEKYDLIISDRISEYTGYEKTHLVTETLAVAFPKEHPLSQKESISATDIKDEQFIMMSENSNLSRITKEYAAQNGFVPKITIECEDPYYLRNYIEIGLGIGIVPMFSWKGRFSENIICRELCGVTRTTYILRDPDRYITTAIKEFCSLLENLCKEK